MANRSGPHGATPSRGRERDNAYRYDHADMRQSAGYSRSDDRLREDIAECMTYDSLLETAEIEVKVEEGQVTLTGTVASKGESLRAQELAAQVHGVKAVRNSLRVSGPGVGTTGNATGGNAARVKS